MAFMDRLRRLFKEDQVKPIIAALDEKHAGEAPQIILPEVHYFRIHMVEMFIKRKRWLGKSFFPAVQGLVSATYGGDDLELPSVADTSKLFGENGVSGDIAVRNFSLTPLLPYRGNTVQVACGLFGMEGENYLGKVIKVLSDFGGLLAVPQLTAILDVAEPLASGLQNLFAADGSMHLGYHEEWVSVIDPQNPEANAFRSGYIAVIRAGEGEVDRSALRVEKQQLRIVTDEATGETEPFTAKDHMLIRIEGRSERDDLIRLRSFYQPFTEALEALGDDEQEKAVSLMKQSLAAARTSVDLTDADRSRVTSRLKELYFAAKEDLDFRGAFEEEKRAEKQLQSKTSAFAAYEAGVPTLEELWDGL